MIILCHPWEGNGQESCPVRFSCLSSNANGRILDPGNEIQTAGTCLMRAGEPGGVFRELIPVDIESAGIPDWEAREADHTLSVIFL